MQTIKQSSTAYPLLFLMIDSSNHITGKVGLTPTVTISKGGGVFGAPSGAISEIGSGWYKVAGNATDTGTLGAIILHATSAGADPTDTIVGEVVAYDPQAANLGLTDVPVDVVKVSGDSTAADNLELDYDGTGYAKANSTIGTATNVTNDVGITQAAADKVWNTAARTLTSFGTLVADVWAYGTRSLTTFGTLVADIWAYATRTLSSFGTLVANINTNLSSAHGAGNWDATATAVDLNDTATTKGIIAKALKDQNVSGTAAATGSVFAAMAKEATLGAPAVSVTADIAAVKGDTAAILLDTGTDGVLIASAAKTGMKLASDGLDTVVVETGENARQTLAVVRAATLGVSSGNGQPVTTARVFKAKDGATTRISGTIDADGNRTAVTVTLPT